MATSHDLEVKEADVLNTYMMAPNKEFGFNAGSSAIIFKASNEYRCIV